MKLILLACGVLVRGTLTLTAQEPLPGPTPAPAPAATPDASPPPVAVVVDDETQLLNIEQEWCNAYLHSDAGYLSRLLTDDFVFTNGQAETSDKTAELQQARDRTVHYTVFENRDMTVRLHGDTAVVTGRTRCKGTVAATGKFVDAEMQFTAVFARVQGRWRAVAAHVSRAGGEVQTTLSSLPPPS